MQFAQGRSPDDFSERLKLYERARAKSLWRPDVDIDWDRPSTLDDDKRELAANLACTGTYTEELGLVTCARLLTELDDLPARYALALQITDEAKHSEAFTRYAHRMNGTPPPVPEGVLKICSDLESIENPTALFLVHTLLEGFAYDQFSYMRPAFEGDPLGDIYKYVIADEARHVAMGMDYLRFALYQDLSDEVMDTLDWCEANVFAIGFVNPELMTWLAEISGKPSSDISHTFETRHRSRIDRIWRRGEVDEEACNHSGVQDRLALHQAAGPEPQLGGEQARPGDEAVASR